MIQQQTKRTLEKSFRIHRKDLGKTKEFWLGYFMALYDQDAMDNKAYLEVKEFIEKYKNEE